MDVFEWVAIAIVTITSSARLTRLATFDEFPPVRWVRHKFEDALDGSSWQMLAYCPWCASPWVTTAVVLSGYFSDWHTVWWLINSIFGAAYLAAMLMVRDGDTSGDEQAADGEV